LLIELEILHINILVNRNYGHSGSTKVAKIHSESKAEKNHEDPKPWLTRYLQKYIAARVSRKGSLYFSQAGCIKAASQSQ